MTINEAGKNNNNKWIWIGLGAATLFCLCAVGAAVLVFMRLGQQVREGMKTEPEDAAVAAHAIADYDLPEGYQERMAMDVMFYTMVFIGPDTSNSTFEDKPVIMLAQFGAMGDPEQMQEQIRRSMEQQSGRRGMTMTLVEVQNMTIRGEEVEVFIYEGTDSRNFTMRQLVTTFPGKDGTAMLMIMGDALSWDQDEIDTFIKSIR